MEHRIYTSNKWIKEKINNPIAYGTNITLPFLFDDKGRNISLTLSRYAKLLVKGNKKKDWGKKSTIKMTRNLIPCVRTAIKHNIFIFDCARAYGGSEQRLAKAIQGIPREQIYLITKIDDRSQFEGKVLQCFEKSLQNLKTSYIDLLMLHWPVDYPKTGDKKFDNSVPVFVRSWKMLEQIYKSGKAKAIGVANFSIRQLKTLEEYAEIMPMANEFECHPLCIRKELNAYCQEHGIQVLAYASLCAMDERLVNEQMTFIAEQHKKSIAQIILKWHIQRGRIPIFGTSRPDRIKEYSNLTDFCLCEDELDIIDGQNINYRAFPDSEHCDFTKGIWWGWENYKNFCP